jgi:di/tricarboxylate transporter
MKLLKVILAFRVDLIFGLIMLGLLIWHMINQEKNFTVALWPVFGYVVFNVINKATWKLRRDAGIQ